MCARYAKPRILIEFDQLEEIDRFAKGSPWNFSTTNRTISIDVATENAEMSAVLSRLHDENFQVRKVERQTASLEEIFLEVAVIQ